MRVIATSCCGVGDISYLSDFKKPEIAMMELCSKNETYTGRGVDHEFAHYLFTQAHSKKKSGGKSYGDKFEAFIIENNLGTVVKTPMVKTNPNTGNYITGFIWTPNKPALNAWYRQNKSKIKVKKRDDPWRW